jgi:cell division protein FtsQ
LWAISTWLPSHSEAPVAAMEGEAPVLSEAETSVTLESGMVDDVQPVSGDQAIVVRGLAPARRRRLRPVIAAAIGVMVVASVAWRVTDSGLFDLRSLQVKGVRHLGAKQIAHLGGLGPGTNVLWLRPGRVAAAIRSDPWVLSVRVSRTLPSTITLEVKERVPVAELAGTPALLVAADGVVLGPAGRRSALPVIDVLGRLPAVGSRLPASLPPLAAISSLSPGLRRQVTGASVDPYGELTLTLRDGARVLYGDASDAAAKGAALAAVLAWARTHDVLPGSIDVRSASAPAMTPAGPVSSALPSEAQRQSASGRKTAASARHSM